MQKQSDFLPLPATTSAAWSERNNEQENSLNILICRTSTFGFGGIGCKINWDRNTKKCSLQINGIRQVDSWLDKQCGQGCQFDQLEYLGLEQVGQAATQGDGVRFKVIDD